MCCVRYGNQSFVDERHRHRYEVHTFLQGLRELHVDHTLMWTLRLKSLSHALLGES